MEEVVTHLSVAELEARFRAASDARSTRHLQAIWLLAKGHRTAEVAATTAFGVRWVEKLRARYNAEGPEALGDLRRHNGRGRTVLTPALLDGLRLRLAEPPPDGGLWTSRKVAAWMAGELGLAAGGAQRGWGAPRAGGGGWAGRSGRRGRTPRPGRRRRSGRRSKKARRRCRRGGGEASGQGRRGLRHGRAPRRAEADPPPRLGAEGRAAARPRPPPLRVALRDRLRPAGLGRGLLVLGERGLETVLRGAPRPLRPRGRRRSRPDHRPRPRRCGLAHGAGAGRPRGRPARPPPALLARVAAGRMPLAGARRAARRQAFRDHPGPRPRRRRALRHVRGRPRPLQGKGRLPLVAEARQLGLIIRKAYEPAAPSRPPVSRAGAPDAEPAGTARATVRPSRRGSGTRTRCRGGAERGRSGWRSGPRRTCGSRT